MGEGRVRYPSVVVLRGPGSLKAGTEVANENKWSVKPPLAVLGEVGEELSCLATIAAGLRRN